MATEWQPLNGHLLVRPGGEAIEGRRVGEVVARAPDAVIGAVEPGWIVAYYAEDPTLVDGLHLIPAGCVAMARPPKKGDA